MWPQGMAPLQWLARSEESSHSHSGKWVEHLTPPSHTLTNAHPKGRLVSCRPMGLEGHGQRRYKEAGPRLALVIWLSPCTGRFVKGMQDMLSIPEVGVHLPWGVDRAMPCCVCRGHWHSVHVNF